MLEIPGWLGDRMGGRPTVPGEWADSAGHAAGSHSSGPTMNPAGGGEPSLRHRVEHMFDIGTDAISCP